MFAEYVSDFASPLDEEDFLPPEGEEALFPVLYATIPTESAFRRLLAHWRRYQRGETPSRTEGLMPWWNMFDMLIDMRPWGPEDRFPKGVREIIAERLPEDDRAPINLELEIWPSRDNNQRAAWREEVAQSIQKLGGRIIDQCSINEWEFIYDALLVELAAGDVRALLENPFMGGGLASVHGLQFILPQTVAQSGPMSEDPESGQLPVMEAFDDRSPARAVLFDGVPVAAHPSIDGGVIVEDIHGIEAISPVASRFHGTAMASLILRGDLESEGDPVRDSLLISVPVLVDGPNGARSRSDRLFIDDLYTALTRCFVGDEPLAPDAFVVNFSIGVTEQRYAGRVSAMARLLDWWSWKHGVLFAVSAGNIPEDLSIRAITSVELEDEPTERQQGLIRSALSDETYGRSLLAPAEALNVLTVGAISEDITPKNNPNDASLVRFERGDEQLPHVSMAVGLGPAKALKPDLLAPGGIQELRIKPGGDDTRLGVSLTQRTGLVVASPGTARGPELTRCRGTSPATALTTRALLQAAAALTEDDGPYAGTELPRRHLALATRALAVNAATWPDAYEPFEADAKEKLGAARSHTGVKDQVARYFGHGVLEPVRMIDGPKNGATLIGIGEIRKDQARLFRLALPPSLSGEKLPRFLRVTLAWFSPVAPQRAIYRCAALEASCIAEDDQPEISDWKVRLKGFGPDANMIGRGTVWSKRLVPNRQTTPEYLEGDYIPIRVQCREAGTGGLSPDDDVMFAIAASFEIEGDVRFNVYEEIREQVRLRQRAR